jgi:O-antigen/teichoic acid export membrane protein
LTLARSVATVVLRILLIVGMGMGVLGVVLADVAVTTALMLVLVRWFAPLLRPTFSRDLLREALRFGLPRVPHAAAQQVTAIGDKFLLALFRSTAEIGVYSMAVSFGLTQKLFLSAFEQAWAPFYYANAREPDAPRIFSSVATYALAVLMLLTAGLSAAGGDLLEAVTGPDYAGAGNIVAWTAAGVLCQGVYLLTSIGLNLTKHTEYYPVATITAAGTNIGLNLLLIPRFGILGAAWANAAAYALQAAIAFRFSQRFYPIAYETGRLARVAAAGALAILAGRALPDLSPWVAVLARGTTVVVVFVTVLWATGFFKPDELKRLRRLRRKPAPMPSPAVTPAETTELAGEIVSADAPDEALLDPRGAQR